MLYLNKRIKDYSVAKNLFCIEGADLTGKTTLQHYLVDFYKSKEISMLPLVSPGETVVGNEIRTILKKYEMPSIAQQCLFNASESIIFETVFNENDNFIFDRCWISRLVYQYALTRKFSFIEPDKIYEIIERMINCGIKLPYNNIILLFKNAETIKKRLESRSKKKGSKVKKDVFEKNGYEKINNAYCAVVNALQYELEFEDIMRFHTFVVDDMSISDLTNKVVESLDIFIGD